MLSVLLPDVKFRHDACGDHLPSNSTCYSIEEPLSYSDFKRLLTPYVRGKWREVRVDGEDADPITIINQMEFREREYSVGYTRIANDTVEQIVSIVPSNPRDPSIEEVGPEPAADDSPGGDESRRKFARLRLNLAR